MEWNVSITQLASVYMEYTDTLCQMDIEIIFAIQNLNFKKILCLHYEVNKSLHD